MTLNPEVQAKAQSEIDNVLENGRLPEFGDQELLPYVTAVMKEVLRYVRYSFSIVHASGGITIFQHT